MRALARDNNNDLYLNNRGELAMASDLQACLQACESAAMAVLDEMIYKQGDGLPYFDALWSGRINPATFEAGLRKAIARVENVERITALEIGVITENEIAYAVEIQTKFGIGAISYGV